MGNRSRNPDRADPLRGLSQAIARGSLEILQQRLCVQLPTSNEHPKGGERGSGAGLGDPLDLTHRCEWCNTVMGPGRADRKYCSKACCVASEVGAISAALREARAGRMCEHCSGPISAERRADAIYCCDKCQNAASHSMLRQRRHMTCIRCGAGFMAHTDRQKHCSWDCAFPSPQIRRERICPACGGTFRTGQPHQRYCSRSCMSAALRSAPRKLTRSRFDAMMRRPKGRTKSLGSTD